MGIGTGGVGQKATAGGLAPTAEQAALAQYHFGQGAVKAEADFAQMPHSTNVTQAISGARAGQAKEFGATSLANTEAQKQFINQQTSNLFGGIGSALGSIAGK